MDHREHTETQEKKNKAAFRARGVPLSQLHPRCTVVGSPAHSWARLEEELAVGSSPAPAQFMEPRRGRPRSSKVFRCLAPAACPQNPAGWGLHNSLSIIWELCGSPDLTPAGPDLESRASFIAQRPINTPRNRRGEILTPKVQPAHHPPVSMAAESTEGDKGTGTGSHMWHLLNSPNLSPCCSGPLGRDSCSLFISLLSAELVLFPLEPR